MDSQRILVVDDDSNICELLELYLKNEGFNTVFAHDGSAAINAVKNENIDLVLLDVMLPVINGWEVCKIIKKSYAVPVIMLTARDLVEDKIQGFELGADDYIVKPFDPREVVVRIKARLKRDKTFPVKREGYLEIDKLTVDINRYEVINNGQFVELKPKETQLIYFLLLNKNIVFSRDQLLEKVWGYDFAGETRTVDVHIKRLREKLEAPETSWIIKTIWGVGYKLEVR